MHPLHLRTKASWLMLASWMTERLAWMLSRVADWLLADWLAGLQDTFGKEILDF